jgi:hypothetical protein
MKSYHLFVFVFVTVALLTACSSSVVEQETMSGPLPVADDAEKPAIQESALASAGVIQPNEKAVEQAGESSGAQIQALWPDGEAKFDEQGYVEVAVTPLNLNAPDETLKFDVGLNTHSVDLSMDLAPLATLEADNGLGVRAVLWDAPRGGHHVSGVLSFPTRTEGVSLLEGASRLTLKILDVDAPERTFTWSLTG